MSKAFFQISGDLKLWGPVLVGSAALVRVGVSSLVSETDEQGVCPDLGA
jgi:hypothetical protein